MTDKRRVGRPNIHDPLDIAERLNKYIDDNENPSVVGFCVNTVPYVSKDTLYRLEKECVQLSDALKRLHEKVEERIVRLTEEGKIPFVFSIFRLKQKRFGWTDKQEIDIDAKVQMPNITLNK